MDKKLLKEFAMKSRVSLTALVTAKLHAMHVTEDIAWVQKGEVYQATIDGRNVTLYPSDKARYDNLRAAIKTEGVKQIVEKAAYTWFNRIVAIRYMELNEMLPEGKHNEWLGIRVLSDGNDLPDPEILKISNLRRGDLDLPLDVDALLKLSRDDEKFRELLFAVVKKLGTVMPDVFNGDTTSINFLLPDNLLGAGGFVNEILKLPTSCFDRVEVIGWLYQYYNQAEKEILATKGLRRSGGYLKEQIPYATQFFTPDWIVKYMVENTLGRYWLEHGGDPNLTENWKYLVKDQSRIKPGGTMPNIEEVTFIDPCAGSGHILVYAFEVFYQIYRSLGYAPEQIPEKILNHNIYGLDIDDRAKQLSILSAFLVAREHDKDIWSKKIQLNITSVAESNGISSLPDLLKGESRDLAVYLVDTFRDAKEYGSILKVKSKDYSTLSDAVKVLPRTLFTQNLPERTEQLIHQANILSRRYNVVVTNPPYMDNFGEKLRQYVETYYNGVARNLYPVFIIKALNLMVDDGYVGMLTPDKWLSGKSQRVIRDEVLKYNIDSMLHLGGGAFGETGIETVAFVISGSNDNGNTGEYIRLTNERDKQNKALEIISGVDTPLKYRASRDDFDAFPDRVVVYWAKESIKNAFLAGRVLASMAKVSQGLATSNNNRFLRLWYEVESDNLQINAFDSASAVVSNKMWFPYNKGGEYRKWYGNNDFVVNWKNNGISLRNYKGSVIRNSEQYFKPSLTWSNTSSGSISFRYKPAGHIFDVNGPSIFSDSKEDLMYLHAVLNSKAVHSIASVISPTRKYEVGEVASYPIILSPQYLNEVIRLVEENRALSKADWDSFETSWDFETHPLFPSTGEKKLNDTFATWEREAAERWSRLKANEERLNEIFINVYGMQDELTPEVEDKYVSVRQADAAREARSLLSYFVGVIFGRYSLDKPGLNFAGGEWNASQQSALVDTDNIVPIMDGEYYTDDIVKKLRDILAAVYGETTLHANMDWLANAIGRKSHENAEDTLRRYFVDDFFADHFRIYGKRPIYWLLSSGKANGFKALFYLHRYQPNLIATVRTQYLLRTQDVYAKRLAELEAKSTLNNDELRLKNDLITKLAEIKSYDALIAVAASQSVKLDLDDGVKVNYPKLSQAAASARPGSEILETKGVKL